MNVLLTRWCNSSCPYCFAAGYLDPRTPQREMEFTNFVTILGFLTRSDHKFIQLAGGEPTLHSRFSEMMDYAIVEGFEIRILSNGLFDDRIRDYLCRRTGLFRLMLMNVNERVTYTSANWEKIRANLKALGFKTSIGINIYRPNQDLNYVIDLAQEFRVSGIRFVFVHHSGDRPNPNSIPYGEIPKETDRLTRLVEYAGRTLGLTATYDCGFVPCLFNDYQLGVLKRWNSRLGGCDHRALAVDADLTFGHCFYRTSPRHLLRLQDYETLADVEEEFKSIKKSFDDRFLFDDCLDCPERRIGSCNGGCWADRRILGVVGTRPNPLTYGHGE